MYKVLIQQHLTKSKRWEFMTVLKQILFEQQKQSFLIKRTPTNPKKVTGTRSQEIFWQKWIFLCLDKILLWFLNFYLCKIKKTCILKNLINVNYLHQELIWCQCRNDGLSGSWADQQFWTKSGKKAMKTNEQQNHRNATTWIIAIQIFWCVWTAWMYILSQCCGSGSVCFWASWIRIR